MRVMLDQELFAEPSGRWESGRWPASWITLPGLTVSEPVVLGFRQRVMLGQSAKVRLHVSADERYELFVDGQRIGRGPERGDLENWFYESYDLELSVGEHVIVAKVWWLGAKGPSPYAQMTARPGFLLMAEGVDADVLNTGVAPWSVKRLGGYRWVSPEMAWGTGAKVHIVGREFAWGFERGAGEGWVAAEAIVSAFTTMNSTDIASPWRMRHAILPPMLEVVIHVGRARHVHTVEGPDLRDVIVDARDHLADEAVAWDALLDGRQTLTIPRHTPRRIIIDLEDYYCAYPQLVTSGGDGSIVRILWAEGLFIPGSERNGRHPAKGNRDEVESKRFVGVGDTFEPDGGAARRFETLWWEAGRYLEVYVATADQPLTIDSFELRQTHYPCDFSNTFDASDRRLVDVLPIARRVMEMCSHETYMDCPYYEQLMYSGDGRLELLTAYVMSRDDRLPRKAIEAFDWSRRGGGLTQSRYPSRVTQMIPPFSLWWIGMVYDYAMWRDDPAFVKDRMIGVRSVLDAYRRWINADGLLEAPPGWNYMDWVPAWRYGVPPDGAKGISGIACWQLAVILKLAGDLEQIVGEPELAARDRRDAQRIAQATAAAFWDESRGLFADDLRRQHFSEHSQCLALLGDFVEAAQRPRVIAGLLDAPDLARTTILFTHYLFETYRLIGRMDRFVDRMGLWFEHADKGLRTTIEVPDPTRSDCHAWGAHPVYHYYASLLGIRPASPGFARVRIEPQLAGMTHARGTMPHPRGFIAVNVHADNEQALHGEITLPEGLNGQFVANGQTMALHGGHQTV